MELDLPDSVLDKIADRVVAKLLKSLESKKDVYGSKREAARMLGVSVRTIDNNIACLRTVKCGDSKQSSVLVNMTTLIDDWANRRL